MSIRTTIRNAAIAVFTLLAGTIATHAQDFDGPQATSDWTGPYLGAHIGYTAIDAGGAVVIPALGPFSANLDGVIGGGLIGYNFQHEQLVFGVEADVSGVGVDETFAVAAGIAANVEVDLAYSFRGRLGVVVNPGLMLFATAGVGLAHADVALTAGLGSDSETFVGVQVGGGLEWEFMPGLGFRAEYLYTDYGRETLRFAGGAVVARADAEMHVGRAALIWRF